VLKLASWNVNSLKIRLEQVLDWMDKTNIDILALQETKTIDDNFPVAAFTERGYQLCFAGQKTFNGVAIISRQPLANIITDIPDLDDPQRRILASTIAGVRLINLYVPNGSEVNSEKYLYKLNWLEKVSAFIANELREHEHLAVVGDFNIAPEDCDVHDPAAWEGSVLVSPPEREAFARLLSYGLKDSFRLFPQEARQFSWWDYRALGFRRNRGLRIDHVLLTQSLVDCCLSSKIDKDARRAERPSDHAPVWVELDILP